MPKQIKLDDIIREQSIDLELFFKYPDGEGNTIILAGHADQVREELDKQFVCEILRKIYQPGAGRDDEPLIKYAQKLLKKAEELTTELTNSLEENESYGLDINMKIGELEEVISNIKKEKNNGKI